MMVVYPVCKFARLVKPDVAVLAVFAPLNVSLQEHVVLSFESIEEAAQAASAFQAAVWQLAFSDQSSGERPATDLEETLIREDRAEFASQIFTERARRELRPEDNPDAHLGALEGSIG